MSDLISRQAAIKACHKDYDNILDFRSNGWTVASSFEEILNALPPIQPDLIDKIQNGIDVTNANDSYSCGMRNGMRWCISLINGKDPSYEECPSAQPENDWIPVTKKKYPDKEGGYLVTDDAGGVKTVDRDEFILLDDGTPCWLYSQNVTAWQELPEPYTEVGKDGNQ